MTCVQMGCSAMTPWNPKPGFYTYIHTYIHPSIYGGSSKQLRFAALYPEHAYIRTQIQASNHGSVCV